MLSNWQTTPDLADAYGRVCARYADADGQVRGENRYLFMCELALILTHGGEHGLRDAEVRATVNRAIGGEESF
jgi:hypothetical protein